MEIVAKNGNGAWYVDVFEDVFNLFARFDWLRE